MRSKRAEVAALLGLVLVGLLALGAWRVLAPEAGHDDGAPRLAGAVAPPAPTRGPGGPARAGAEAHDGAPSGERVAAAPAPALEPEGATPASTFEDEELDPDQDAEADPLGAWIRRWLRDAARPPGESSFSFESDLPETVPAVEGVVRRRRDGAPVEGAEVTWAAPSARPTPPLEASFARAYTDAQGRFRLERSSSARVGPRLTLAIRVAAPGLAVATAWPGGATWLEVHLEPEASLEVRYPAVPDLRPRLVALDVPVGLQDALDAQAVAGDDRLVIAQIDVPEAGAPPPEEAVLTWARLPAGGYELAFGATRRRLRLAAGEARALRLEAPEARAFALEVTTPAGAPVDSLVLILREASGGPTVTPGEPPHLAQQILATDARGRLEGEARAGALGVTALVDATASPDLAWLRETGTPAVEVDLGVVPGHGEHRRALPEIGPFTLRLPPRPLADFVPLAQLVCRTPGHACTVVASIPDPTDGLVTGGAHAGRWAVLIDLAWLGDVELPGDVALLPPAQTLAVRWRVPAGLPREQALRGAAWLYPAWLEAQPPLRQGGAAWGASPRQRWGEAAVQFWADAHGRLAALPELGARTGARLPWYAPGRYVLAGWSDLGPLRVEVDLPAPGGLDVVLAPP